ncbi:MAG: hypothetical protein ACK4WH_07405, partial [Phycisphaerales bacterium]
MYTHLTRGLLALLTLGAVSAFAQPTSDSPLAPPPNSVRRVEPGVAVGEPGRYALAGATLHPEPGRTIENATLLIRAGRVESILPAGGAVPPGIETRQAVSLHVYAGFIEPYLEVDAPRPDAAVPGSHWSPHVTPQRNALDGGAVAVDDRVARSLREMGFAAAAVSPRGGVFRGSSAVVSLAEAGRDPSAGALRVYRDRAYQSVAFETGRGMRGDDAPPDVTRWSAYPNSQMGAIAIIRQTFADADRQSAARRAGSFLDPPNALDPLDPGAEALYLFDTGNDLEALRAAKIAREFNRRAAILGSGHEYKRLAPIIADGLPIVLPLNYPRPPAVGTVGEQNAAELADLMHWEQAPTNPRRVDAALREAGRAFDVSLTTSKSADR